MHGWCELGQNTVICLDITDEYLQKIDLKKYVLPLNHIKDAVVGNGLYSTLGRNSFKTGLPFYMPYVKMN